MRQFIVTVICLVAAVATSRSAFADIIPSPSNDIALQANGGVAYGDGTSWDAAHGPDKLNDGNRDGNFGDNPTGLYHDNNGGQGGSFGVVLAGPNVIDQVDLFTRTDCCDRRIDGNGAVPFTITILLGGVPQFTQNYTFSNDIFINGADGSAEGTVKSIPNILGDEVRITQNNADYINIAELEAYAAIPEPASLSLLSLGAVGFLARRRNA